MIWTHSDPNLPASVNSAMARLRSADWTAGSAGAQARDLQALCALKAILVGHLLGTISYSQTSSGDPTADIGGTLDTSVGERADAARALVAPLVFYYDRAGFSPLPNADLQTTAPGDVGLWPIPVIIAVSVAGAAVLGWVAHETAGVVRYFKSVDSTQKEIQRLDAQVTDMLNRHVQDEKTTSQQKALSDDERAQIGALNKRIGELTGKLGPEAQPSALASVPWYAWTIGAAAVVGLGALAIYRPRPLARAA